MRRKPLLRDKPHLRGWSLARGWLGGGLVAAIVAGSMLYAPTDAHADSVTGKYIQVALERTDTLGDKIYVGDTLTYKITYTNVSDTDFVAFPKQSNLTNAAVGDAKQCRWDPLKAGQTAECGFPFHVVTQDDVANGFTPYVIFDAAKDRNNTVAPYEADIRVEDATVNIESEARPDPATIPTPREDGVPVQLGGPGTLGFGCTRIVALAVAPNNDLLAAFDGRPASCGDAPNPNSIVVRTSSDQGQSWSEPKVAIQGNPPDSSGSGKYGFSDPSFVVDKQAGKVFLFSVKSFNAGLLASKAGTDPNDPNVLQAQVSESDDNGATWSQPRIITKDITPDAKYTSRFASSGEGIQLQYGPHAGRLVQQYAFLYNEKFDMHAVSVFSDDHGATWQVGQPTKESGMDENKVVELSNGDLMMNSRASDNVFSRKVAISKDGGETWGPVTAVPQLIDSHNNASITRAFPNAEQGSTLAKVLLFSNAATTSGRHTGAIRLSADDGKTWFTTKVFEPGNMEYSTLTALPEAGKYGLLYEAKPNGVYQIQYEQISLDWLGVHKMVDAQTFVVGTPVNYVVPAMSDAATPLTKCEATGLPAGLQIGLNADKTACVVTGTPTQTASDAAVNVVISYQINQVPAIFFADTTVTVNPAPDADQDGVADGMDKCPATPQGAKVDSDGCGVSPSAGQVNDVAASVAMAIDPITVEFVNPGMVDVTVCQAVGLPDGLTITWNGDASGCVISGTPTKAGEAKVAITFEYTDAMGKSQTLAADPFMISVKAAETKPGDDGKPGETQPGDTTKPGTGNEGDKGGTKPVTRPTMLPKTGAEGGSSFVASLAVLASLGAALVYLRRNR